MANDKYKICKLNEVAWFQEGPGVRKSQFRTSGVKLLNVGNICDRELNLDKTSIYISEEEAYGRYKHFLIDEGDLLIASSGIKVDYFDKKITFARKEHLPLCMNTSTIRFKVIDKTVLDINYLRHFLASRYFTKQVQFHITGSAQLNFGPSHLNKMTIILPPLEEQKKIARILDKADEIRTKKRLANDKLDEFLKSTFISMFGDPVRNNKNWEKGTIRDLIKEAKYGTSGKASSTGEYPILRMGNLTYKGVITYDDLKYIDLKNEEISKYTLQNGDILFNRTNSKELVGKTAIYKSDKPMAFAGYLVRVRTNEKAVPDFISSYMNSDYMKSTLRAKCKNIVGMANINAQEFQDFEIYIPPIELQNKFAQIVEKVEVQKQKNEQVIEQMDNLFNSLSRRAFKGELTKSNVVDLLTRQVALHSKIIDKCNIHQTFGAVKLEKIFNLCDMIQDLNLVPGGYYRKAAGPYVPEMRHTVEQELLQNDWVKITNQGNGKKVEYKKDANFVAYKAVYNQIFNDKNQEIEKIIDYFYDKDTNYCEAFSTLYMCWNDLILEGKNPTKTEIIDEFKNHWAPEKQRFERIYLLEILSDMSNQGFEPQGRGTHTIESNYNHNKDQLSLQLK